MQNRDEQPLDGGTLTFGGSDAIKIVSKIVNQPHGSVWLHLHNSVQPNLLQSGVYRMVPMCLRGREDCSIDPRMVGFSKNLVLQVGITCAYCQAHRSEKLNMSDPIILSSRRTTHLRRPREMRRIPKITALSIQTKRSKRLKE